LICTIDERGHILKLNEHGNRLLDVSQGEDSKIDENFPGLKQEIHALLSDGNPFERNSVPYPDVSSPRSFFNVKGVPLLDPEGNISGGIVLAEDITRQMELQSQITQQEKMASVGLLAAGIAHEFNNIIASLMGFAQISGSREGLGLDKFRELVLKQMTRAKEITDSLTSFSRGSGTERVEASIEEVLSDVFLLVEKELKTNSIRLELNISPLPLIPINVGQIQQVFLNLIINAVHAMKNGGCLSIDAVASEDLVQISFRDTGSGIKPEHLNKIFEPFFTTKGAIGKSRTPGTGLGLSVSYNVILKHEGRMRVESEPGVGTCFYIDLPRKVFLQPGSSSSAPVEWGDGGPPLHRDLLLVMESSTERDEISTYFGENHLTVASNGREALEICLHKYQDIVFIQESLGGEYSALQTIQRIRVIAPNCPVILLAESPEGEKSFVLPEGVDKVIHPPYSSSLLFQCIS
jgi:signal transduction histidine kinase